MALELFQDAVELTEIYDAATSAYSVPWPVSPWRQLTGLRANPERWQRTILDPLPRDMDAEIRCAIVDTGVLTHHPLMRGRLLAAEDFTGEGADDDVGHGTHQALQTAMDVPWIAIVVARVIGQRQVGYEEQVARVARGIDWAAEQEPRVLQLALGRRGPAVDADEPLIAAIRRALDAGIHVVVAGEAQFPAASDERIHALGRDDDARNAAAGATPAAAVRPFEYLSMESELISGLLAGHVAARELGMAPPHVRGAMGYGYGGRR